MANRMIEVPLSLDLDFPGYEPSHFNFAGYPCQPLVRCLVVALFARTNTGGPIKSPFTVRAYKLLIGNAARWFAAHGFDGDVSDLSEDLVFDYWRACRIDHEIILRTLLSDIEAATPGRLNPALVAHLRGMAVNPSPMSKPRQPYSAGETQRLLAACTGVVEAAESAMSAASALAAAGCDPTQGGWREKANLAWLLDRHGPHTIAALAARLGLPKHRVKDALAGTLTGLHAALFPTTDVVLAFRLLVGLQSGICPEGVDGLTADCLEWVGAGEARISWVKARGGGRQNQVFVSRGPWSPGRLIERWLAFSDRARRHAPDPTPLWLFCDTARPTVRKPSFPYPARDLFVARHQLRGDDGAPMRMAFGSLRSTYFARHDRHWNGALRIDSNHSRQVEGDHYLAQTRAVEPIEATIEAAQRDALRKASTAPLSVLGPDALAELQADPAAAAARLKMSERASVELLGGERDVFAAACKDFHHSPYGAAGQPCPVPVWTCLCCPLAVFTPSKVPNLLRLQDHLDRQWESLPAGEWMAMYGAANVRLERDILPKFTAEVIAAASAAIAADRDAIYLRPEEHPEWQT